MKQNILPQEIIDSYAKYRNKKSKLKSMTVLSSRFEIDDNYEIIDNSIFVFFKFQQLAKGHMESQLLQKIRNWNQIKTMLRQKRSKRLLNTRYSRKEHQESQDYQDFQTMKMQSAQTQFYYQDREKNSMTCILFEKNVSYVVSELMETDLAQIIKSDQALSDEHCQFLLYQLLRGLKYIHSANVVHRDLKPRNLLVNSNCDLKICDFGLARALIPELKCKAGILTDYVATRWYRAPELLLSWKDYSTAVDVWSVGCIMAELLRRKPFLPGCDTKNQIELTFEIIGTPSDQELNVIPRDKYRALAKNLPKRPGKPFEKLFPNASTMAIDLLRKLLTFDANQRITIEDALSHPYLSSLHFPDDEPMSVPVQRVDFEFEEYNMTLQQLKDCIYEEILLYHYKDFREQYNLKKSQGQSLISHIVKNQNANVIDPIADEDDEISDDEGQV